MTHSIKPAPKDGDETPAWLEFVRKQVSSLRYGVVQIVVHEGAVTQIETTERVRIEATPTEPRRKTAG